MVLKPRPLKKTNPRLAKFDEEFQKGKTDLGIQVELELESGQVVAGPLILPADKEPVPQGKIAGYGDPSQDLFTNQYPGANLSKEELAKILDTSVSRGVAEFG